ncbi:Pre-mRNA-processing factor 6 [Hypsizygus marmoreus]|uniref:Pre-mRNA-processing factor 6 n=1 Tax=Hypsizygus marmoreus TaxID=39966 RepID=A0A369JIS7_HYPMA|nr:Pre-mRNA-processing factor 6 [Hypsizygus marmoreus]
MPDMRHFASASSMASIERWASSVTTGSHSETVEGWLSIEPIAEGELLQETDVSNETETHHNPDNVSRFFRTHFINAGDDFTEVNTLLESKRELHRGDVKILGLTTQGSAGPKIQQYNPGLKRGLSENIVEGSANAPAESANPVRKKMRPEQMARVVSDTIVVGQASTPQSGSSFSAQKQLGPDPVVNANAAAPHLEQNIDIWLATADLESDLTAKQSILREGLKQNPRSVQLWQNLAKMETSALDARLLLSRAVETIPSSVELRLALARVETIQNAKVKLKRALNNLPNSHELWIALGQLLEDEANLDQTEADKTKALVLVDQTIDAGIKAVRLFNPTFGRTQWLMQAESCERLGKFRCCQAIVKFILAIENVDEAQPAVWSNVMKTSSARGMVVTARAVFVHASKVYPGSQSLWENAASLEKEHGTKQSLDALLRTAVLQCPHAEGLWLMAAKQKLRAGDVHAARDVLEHAFVANPGSEEMWLAAVKLETENGEHDIARTLLVRARTLANTERIWMKSAVLERQQGRPSIALELLTIAIFKFPNFGKLYMIEGQIHQSQENFDQARFSFVRGLAHCTNMPTLWILLSRLEEADGQRNRAHELLSRALTIHPENESIWAELIHVEEASGGTDLAQAMLSRALRQCRQPYLLWAMSIWYEPPETRMKWALDTLSKSKDHPLLLSAVARLYWAEREIGKARMYFERSVLHWDTELGEDFHPEDIGDSWAWWLNFEREYGTVEQQKKVRDKCITARPRHGPIWQATAKDTWNLGKSTEDILDLVAKALQ